MNFDPVTTEQYRNDFSQNGYVVIKNAYPTVLANVLYSYMLTKERLNEGDKWDDNDDMKDVLYLYGDPLYDSLLEVFRPMIEKIIVERLLPTYSFARLYKKGDALPPHKDRTSSEIGVSLNIGEEFSAVHEKRPNYRWPLVVNGEPIVGEQGDIILFKGIEQQHWRDSLQGDQQGQVFFFYVLQTKPYAKACEFDGRPALGFPVASRDLKKLKFSSAIHSNMKSFK